MGNKPSLSTARAVMARPQEVVAPLPVRETVVASPPTREAVAVPPPPRETMAAPETAATTVYDDNWFDKLAIGYLSRNLQEASGTLCPPHS